MKDPEIRRKTPCGEQKYCKHCHTKNVTRPEGLERMASHTLGPSLKGQRAVPHTHDVISP